MKKQKYVLLAIILVLIFIPINLLWQWIDNDPIDVVDATFKAIAMSVFPTLLQVYWDRKKK
jgi:hypothetical protein